MLVSLGILFLLLLIAFLLGSVPWGVVISRLAYKKDLRNEGSGNIGTTNAMRALGKIGGSAVFLLDFGKGLLSGFIATLFAQWLVSFDASTGTTLVMPLLSALGFSATDCAFRAPELASQLALAVAFFGCVFGHMYSPWLKFKGGKGIAVAVGCLFFVFGPLPTGIEILLFAVLVIATRYVSVGSIAAALLCPFIALHLYWGNWIAWALIFVTACAVVFAHRANINRLRNHCENRIGDKKKKNNTQESVHVGSKECAE